MSSLGLVIDNYSIVYLDSIFNKDYNRFETFTDIDGKMMLSRAYAQWHHKIGGRLTTYSGINLQYSGLNSEIAAEPRLGVNYTTSLKGSVNFGFGLHSQLQPKSIYYFQEYNPETTTYLKSNEDVKFSRSAHFVLGYQYMFNDNFRVKLESYYQHLYKVPVKASFPEFSLINSGDQFGTPLQDSLINEGKGKNYGVEITIEKFLKQWLVFPFYFLVI